MFANFATAVFSSTAVTLALFYVMNALIGVGSDIIVEPRERGTLDYVREPKPEDPPRTLYEMPPRELFEPPVTPPAPTQGNPDSLTGVRPPVSGPPPVTEYKGPGVLVNDGPLVSLVRPHPVYPAAALRNELEGWVLVQFDVLASGAVGNIVVVQSSDPVFERSARHAASRFRFKPGVVEGVPQVTPGVQNLFRYRMEQ